MINARKITEHGRENRLGVQVDISGELAEISVELDELLKEIYRAIDQALDDDLEEKYGAYDAFYRIIRKTGRDMKDRIAMHGNGANEDEIREVVRIRHSDMPREEKIREMEKILLDVTNRRLEKDPEEKLAEAIGGEDGKHE
jgi:hypothetical protein